MKFLLTCTMLFSLSSTIPAFSQAAEGTNPSAAAPESGPVDLSGFREQIANKNKALADKVNAEKVLVKKNAVIIQDAKKIDAANKRLEAERKALDAQNAEFEAQRRAMMPDGSDAPAFNGSARPTPASVQRSEPSGPAHLELAGATVIPAERLAPQPAAPVQAPAPRPEPPAAHLELTGATIIPADRQLPAADTRVASVSAPAPSASAATATVTAPALPMRVPEGVSMSMLLTPIRPVYPQIAQTARVEGSVVLDAVINKAGAIESLHAVSGPEMLRRAAMDAVQAAHYQPYRVNGENVQVATTITVVFRMRS